MAVEKKRSNIFEVQNFLSFKEVKVIFIDYIINKKYIDQKTFIHYEH